MRRGRGLTPARFSNTLCRTGLRRPWTRLLVPSVDTIFLVRCSDPISARKEWARVTGMLTEGDQ